jgi:hypothetical protein
MKGSGARRRRLTRRKNRAVRELLAVGENGDGGGNLALIDEGQGGARGAALVHAARWQRGCTRAPIDILIETELNSNSS